MTNLVIHAKAVLKAAVNSQKLMDKQAVKISDKILELYKASESLQLFKQACQEAEGEYRTACAKAGTKDNLPRCWSQAKSDLVGAASAGIDVKSCASVSQAKRKKIEKNKEKVSKEAAHANAGPAKSEDDASLSNNKFVVLSELLGQLSESMQGVMMDTFIEQATKAVNTMSDDAFTQATGGATYTRVKQDNKLAAV